MVHRIGLLLAVLSVLALGLSGYAPEPSDMAASAEQTAMMMADHDCCPGQEMEHGPAPDRGAMPCPNMEDCANGPCGLAPVVLAIMTGTTHAVRLTGDGLAPSKEPDRFFSAVGSSLDHPPRA